MAHYKRYFLYEEISINSIITFYYLELAKNYNIMGEKHDFWEFVYVDKGSLEVYTDSYQIKLNQGDIIFYKPNEFHAGRADQNNAPNLFIVSFDCNSPIMKFFNNKTFRIDKDEQIVLSKLMKEGSWAFDPPAGSLQMSYPKKDYKAPFASEQMFKNYLEILLISFIRKGEKIRNYNSLSRINEENKNIELTSKVIEYMKDNISSNMTVEQICSIFGISRAALMHTFKGITGLGVKEYFNKLKIEQAKRLIREENLNFTEIAERLAYSGLHYFSRRFKKETGMSPSEYSRSVKARC
jgi:AraC-like DNA-binding protein